MGKQLEQTIEKFDPVLVIHSASFSVIKDLSNIFKGIDIDQSPNDFIPYGTLAKRGWDEYQKSLPICPSPDFGEFDIVDLTSLFNPKILQRISEENDLLELLIISKTGN